MEKIGLSNRGYAEDAAYYQMVEPKGLGRIIAELFGRLNQNYSGEFIKLKELELSRYPPYKRLYFAEFLK